MPTIAHWNPDLTVDDLLKRPGLQLKSGGRRRISEAVADALAEIDRDRLIEPSFVYRSHDIAGAGEDWIELNGGGRIADFPVVRCRLEKARMLLAAVCTLGPKLEARASEWFEARRRFKAITLVEIGTATLFAFSSFIKARLADVAAARGFGLGGAISPGDRDVLLAHQRQMVALAGGPEIGVQVSQGAMMLPVNSLSMVYGAGRGMVPHQTLECEVCSARERCRYRRNANP